MQRMGITSPTPDEIVQRVRDLPAMPLVVTQVLRATRDPDSSVADVAQILGTDQGLTARVLRLANSALFGFPRRVATLTDAVVLLGFSTLRSLVLAGTAFGLLNRPVSGYSLDKGALWRHSMGAGVAARLVCQRQRLRRLTEEAFVAGVLHDMGKLVLDTYVREAFSQIIQRVEENCEPFMAAERAVLGYDHAQLGAMAAEAWALPADLCEAIRLHHEPLASSEPRLFHVVHVADVIALSLGMGLGSDGLNYAVDSSALETLGLSGADVEELISQMPDALTDIDTFLGEDGGAAGGGGAA